MYNPLSKLSLQQLKERYRRIEKDSSLKETDKEKALRIILNTAKNNRRVKVMYKKSHSNLSEDEWIERLLSCKKKVKV